MKTPSPTVLGTALVVAALAVPAAGARAQPVTVQGTVIHAGTGEFVPGLTAFLVHQWLGRSSAATTNGYGRFTLDSIPLHSEPYYLELYWGERLIYRRALAVTRTAAVNGRVQVPLISIGQGGT